MKIDKRWFLLFVVAATAATGAALATSRRRRQLRAVSDRREHKAHIKHWENEGGNFAPAEAVLLQP